MTIESTRFQGFYPIRRCLGLTAPGEAITKGSAIATVASLAAAIGLSVIAATVIGVLYAQGVGSMVHPGVWGTAIGWGVGGAVLLLLPVLVQRVKNREATAVAYVSARPTCAILSVLNTRLRMSRPLPKCSPLNNTKALYPQSRTFISGPFTFLVPPYKPGTIQIVSGFSSYLLSKEGAVYTYDKIREPVLGVGSEPLVVTRDKKFDERWSFILALPQTLSTLTLIRNAGHKAWRIEVEVLHTFEHPIQRLSVSLGSLAVCAGNTLFTLFVDENNPLKEHSIVPTPNFSVQEHEVIRALATEQHAAWVLTSQRVVCFSDSGIFSSIDLPQGVAFTALGVQAQQITLLSEGGELYRGRRCEDPNVPIQLESVPFFRGKQVTRIATATPFNLAVVREKEGRDAVYGWDAYEPEDLVVPLSFPTSSDADRVQTICTGGSAAFIERRENLFVFGCLCKDGPRNFFQPPINYRHNFGLCIVDPQKVEGIIPPKPRYWYPLEATFVDPQYEETNLARSSMVMTASLLWRWAFGVGFGVDDMLCDVLSFGSEAFDPIT